MGIIEIFVKKIILKNFFNIGLSANEREIAEETVSFKYKKAIKNSIILGALAFPAILFLDTELLALVLIPATMVSGSAWFAISLASMKKKFEKFGLELTVNMFTSFLTSLIILALLSVVSLNPLLFNGILFLGESFAAVKLVSGILGAIVILKLLYDLFVGSLKYDVNDAMLSGQNEAAEKFYKRSLSFLHEAAMNLRAGKGLEVANYYLGVSFYEIFSFMRSNIKGLNGELENLKKNALKLRTNPSMDQEKADKISIGLLDGFVSRCRNIRDTDAKKNYDSICLEIDCLKNNKKEDQSMIDTRLSIIFEEMAELLENQGDSLFKKEK